MPATGSCPSSAAPLTQGTGTCSLSATPLSYDIDQATRAGDPGAALLSQRTGGRAPSAPSPRHAPRRSSTAAPERRSFQRGCPPPPGHAVAVGLRCAEADTEAPRSRVKLGSAFPRNSGGRSTLFLVKEEPIRLAISHPFPNRSTSGKPPPADYLLPPTGAPLLKSSTGSAGLFRLHAR